MTPSHQQSIPGLVESLQEPSLSKSASYGLLSIEGPPGSGKTRALAKEAIRIVQEKADPAKKVLILAVTAQNKRRVEHYLTLEVQAPTPLIEVATFDRFFLQWLRQHRQALPFECSELTLPGELEAQVLLQGILNEVLPDGHSLRHAAHHFSSAAAFYDAIRQLQLKGLTPADLDACQEVGERFELLKRVYALWLERTRTQGLLSFPDLLHMASRLSETSETVLSQLRDGYHAVLADEAQELSAGHLHFLKQLALPLVLAGTRQLSIRSFRGAEPEIFSGLSEHFTDLQSTTLTDCVRGNTAILALVNDWLPTPLIEKTVPNSEALHQQVQFGMYTDPEAEARGVAAFILKRKQEDPSLQWHDFAVLLRSAAYRPYLLNAFVQKNIPVMLDGFPDGLIHTQHLLYDWLNVLHAFEILQLPPDFSGLDSHLARLDLPLATLEEALAQANRHLARWIGSKLEDNPTEELRQALGVLGESDEVLLLNQLLKAATIPPGLQKLLEELKASYAALRQGEFLPELLCKELIGLPQSAELDAFAETVQQLSTQYEQTCRRPLPIEAVLSVYPSLWQQESLPEETSRVRVLSIHQAQGDEFPVVVIPFLVHEEFPQLRQRSELLSAEEQEKLYAQYGIQWRFRNDEEEERRLLATGLTRASRTVLLSSHRTEGGKPVLPSQFYRALLDLKRRLLGQADVFHACWCEAPEAYDAALRQAAPWVDACSHQTQVEDKDAKLHPNALKSTWASLEKQAPEPLYAHQNYLQISASSIKLYMECPRKYYYKQTLRLPEGDSYAASLGLLIHSLMEAFNLQAAEQPYTAQRLKQMAEAMFTFETPEEFVEAGFKESMFESLAHMNPLALADLRESLMAAIDDLEAKGYFDKYAQPKAVEAELDLNDVMIDGIERTVFRGKIDALIQRRDGTWDIIDYKTYQSGKFNTKNSPAHFLATLDPLPDDETLSHKARFQDKLHPQYPKDYQLPLYYLATRNNPKYQGKINAVALQLLRPPFKDNGSIRLEIPAAAIDAVADQLAADINTQIVKPILEAKDLPMNPSRSACGYCSYFRICESNGGDGDEGGFGE